MSETPIMSRVILGSMGLSGLRQTDVDRILHSAVDAGISAIDTAPLYGFGRCEELIGNAIAGRRDRVLILSKCGLRWHSDHGARMFEAEIDGERRWVRKDSRPDSIMQEIDDSLRRLRVDTIDVMQIHQLDLASNLDESLGALERAITAGKINAVGVSNFPLEQVRQAQRIFGERLFSVQDEFNMISTCRSAELIAHCNSNAIRFFAYSPLARGILAGKYLDSDLAASAAHPASDYTSPSNLEKINRFLRETALPIARAHRATLTRTCLAWTLAQPGVTHVIAGATHAQQATDNAAAMRLQLTPEETDQMSRAVALCRLESRSRTGVASRVRKSARRLKNLARGVIEGVRRSG